MKRTTVTDQARADVYRRFFQRETRNRIVCSIALALTMFVMARPANAEGAAENIAIALSSEIVESPFGSGAKARVVPGTVLDFSVSVRGPVESGSPATSFTIVDLVPERLSLFVGDLQRQDSGPALFKDNDSGLEFQFGGLASEDDAIAFSNDGGASFDYVPQADSEGYDPNVTHIKLKPRGALLPTTGRYERFSIRYRMKVK